MRTSDILGRQLHNLVSNTNLWITPEHKDDNKEDTTMRSTEHNKEVDKLIKEINKLNENSKGLIVDLGDYTEIKKGLENIQLTLLRNMKTYIEEMNNKLAEEISKM